ncbi:MAG: hypothetical protein HRT61_13770, partial [Ekhidna sp.]|nr:hypothetical protein [Ekhidna sp.]
MRHVLLLGLTICFATTLLFGQQQTEKVKAIKVANTTAVYLGKVKPTTEKYKFTSLDKRNDARRNKQLPPNFIGRGKSKVTRPELEHQGPDPLRQTKFSNRFRTIIEPLVNVDGLSNSFGSPHDPSGSIGVNNYMQAINATVIGIFDKSGSQLAEFAANSLWEPLGENGIGDPIILFDHETSQWIITEFAQPALLLFAVSETSDPAGDYNVYSFATPTFPDYPKYGIWTDHVVVTSNESGPGALHQYFIDREALMSGSSDVTIQRVEIAGNTSTEAGFYVTTPVQWNGSTLPGDDKPIALKINDSSWGEVSEDALEVFTFDIDLDNPDNTVVEKTTLTTAPFDSYPCDRESGGFACVSQGGDGSGGLDAIPEVVMNIPHYRNFGTHESIVLNFITDVTDGNNLSGIRWMELRRVDGSDWSIYQEGTFAPDDGLHRFMGSIGMDASGNIGLAYNVSSPSEFAGIRFTGRFADDPLGEMTVEEYTVISGINPINTDRFGDYPHITIDPVDGQTFWFTAEYAGNGSNNSKTRLLAFQLEKKDNDIAVSEISSPNTGGGLTDAETVTASILNNGNLAATGFDIQLVVDGNEIEVFTYEATLDAGATYEHTFSSAVDLSALGDYEIQVSVLYDVDELPGNNSTSKTVTNLPQLNGAISLELETETCNSSFTGIAVLQNQGADEITGAELELFVNGNSSSLVTFEGAIETGRNATIEVVFEDLSSGQNTLSVVINTLNGESDEIASNNSAEGAVNFNADLEQVTLTLLTDEYPGETTWQITNESEEVVLTGGPYEAISTTFVENICLPSDQCYVFTIFDAAGDGICCGFGEGSFSLSDSQGEVIFESDGNFGASQDALICLGDGEFDELDASVSFISDLSEVCLVDFPTSFQIKNEGTENLTSLTVDLNVNGA